jgi:hypothetical protein
MVSRPQAIVFLRQTLVAAIFFPIVTSIAAQETPRSNFDQRFAELANDKGRLHRLAFNEACSLL